MDSRGNRGNNQVFKRAIFCLILLIASVPSHASGLDLPNRYTNIAESLFDMMDAFSSAYNNRIERGRSDNSPWSSNRPFPTPNRSAPAPYGYNALARLNGSWQGQAGEILVIRNGRFRIYLQPNAYQEGRMVLQGEHMLLLQDLSTGLTRQYEFAESQGRLALRDDQENLLLYLRLSR